MRAMKKNKNRKFSRKKKINKKLVNMMDDLAEMLEMRSFWEREKKIGVCMRVYSD